MAEKSVFEKLDKGALSNEQQAKLKQFKIKTRIDNEKYLRSHGEVEILISDFLSKVFLERPVDIREFAADHFSNPDLCMVVGSRMQGNTDSE